MTHKSWLAVCSVLALACFAVAVGAVQPHQGEVPEPEVTTPDLAEMLEAELDTELLMSVDPESTEAAAAPGLLSPDTSWYGICWTSCFPCTSDADCPFGERCRFGVQCP